MPAGSPTPERTGPRARRWPLIVIKVFALVGLVYLWVFSDLQRQHRVMGTAALVLLTFVLFLVWLLFLSRLRWSRRFLVAGMLLGVVLAAALVTRTFFRYEGVTGDLIPILEPRWKPRAQASVEPDSQSVTNQPITLGGRSDRNSDFPQFLGPNRDGVIRGIGLARDWTIQPPALLWRHAVGEGFGGFAIVGDRAVTQEQHGADESVTCYDLFTGRSLWSRSVPARYDNPIGGIGPRATPTIVGGKVYALGATGHLNCLDLATGDLVWTVDAGNAAAAGDLEWGVSSSPLVHGNLIIVSPRGRADASLQAFRAEGGEPVWKAGDAKPHYSSPQVREISGVDQLLTFTERGVAAHDISSGRLLWEHPWLGGQPKHPHVSDPRVIGTNEVLISSAYGAGSQLVRVVHRPDGTWAVDKVVWRSMRLKSKFANILISGRVAYGLDDGRLICLNLDDGSRIWDGERYGHGQLLLVDDVVLLTTETGGVVLVEASPTSFRELTRFQALEGKTWNPPAISGDLLLVRNEREAALYRLPLK